MDTTEQFAGFTWPRIGLRIFTPLLALFFAAMPLLAQQTEQPAAVQLDPGKLQQLVAPIALYPDALVAQVLAASTFPEQIVQADRWVQANPNLQGDALGQAVNQQSWDPSVKALTAFPSVLGNMDKNLAWTSSLGDAYFNQQQDVMAAIQTMRQRAQGAGNLKSSAQQTVTEQDASIVIQPADAQIVYVPAYDPWLVYGGPVMEWPGWYQYPGIWFGGPYLSWGPGFGIGFFGGFGWGWHNWGFDWHNHYAMYNHGRYYSRSNTFYNRSSYARGARENGGNRGGASARPFNGDSKAARGYSAQRGQSGTRSGAFSNYGHGAQARSFSSRGSASVGASHGGGGGGHASGGGGGHSGGGHR
jgi:uncharacterized membrane protein YgcG